MSQLPRFPKKGLRGQASQELRRESSDHDLFSLEYLNNTMNYLLPGKNDFSHSYRFNSDIFEEIINEDVSNLGVLFSERLKQMKPTCNPDLYSRDVQQYGDFINHQLSKNHQREIQSIECELHEQIQFGMAMKRLKQRYPQIVSQNVSLEEGKRLIGRMKEEILQSLLCEGDIINEDTFQRELQKNKLYRELFDLEGSSVGQRQRLLHVVNARYVQNEGGSMESIGSNKPRKGRRSKKALEQRDLEYKPCTVDKIVKKGRMGSSRWGDNSEKPSRIEEQSQNNPDMFAKQLEANSKSKIHEQNRAQEPLFKQTKIQMVPENMNICILDTGDKAKDQAIQGQLMHNQTEMKTQAVVAIKRRHRVAKERVEGQSQNDKKSQMQNKIVKKGRGRKKAEASRDLPPASVSPVHSSISSQYTNIEPNVAEIGIQANPEVQSQNNLSLNSRIVIVKSINSLPHASTEIKKENIDQIQQQQQLQVQVRQLQKKRQEASRSDNQIQQQMSHHLRIIAHEQFEQQKEEDPNADPLDFIDQCLN